MKKRYIFKKIYTCILCDPDGQSIYSPGFPTGAIDAPFRLRWNQEHFDILMENAYPPVD